MKDLQQQKVKDKGKTQNYVESVEVVMARIYEIERISLEEIVAIQIAEEKYRAE